MALFDVFLSDPTFPVCRPSENTHVSFVLFSPFCTFYAFILKAECPCCAISRVEFLQRSILGMFSTQWGGQGVSTMSPFSEKLGETDSNDA